MRLRQRPLRGSWRPSTRPFTRRCRMGSELGHARAAWIGRRQVLQRRQDVDEAHAEPPDRAAPDPGRTAVSAGPFGFAPDVERVERQAGDGIHQGLRVADELVGRLVQRPPVVEDGAIALGCRQGEQERSRHVGAVAPDLPWLRRGVGEGTMRIAAQPWPSAQPVAEQERGLEKAPVGIAAGIVQPDQDLPGHHPVQRIERDRATMLDQAAVRLDMRQSPALETAPVALAHGRGQRLLAAPGDLVEPRQVEGGLVSPGEVRGFRSARGDERGAPVGLGHAPRAAASRSAPGTVQLRRCLPGPDRDAGEIGRPAGPVAPNSLHPGHEIEQQLHVQRDDHRRPRPRPGRRSSAVRPVRPSGWRSVVNRTRGTTANGSCRLSTTWLRISICAVPLSP